MTEHDLQSKIQKELSKHGFFVKRTNVGMVMTKDGRTFNTGLPKGHSDLEVHGNHGDTMFIEVKVESNKPTEEQKHFIKTMQDRGFAAGVAYSVDEALNICGIKS